MPQGDGLGIQENSHRDAKKHSNKQLAQFKVRKQSHDTAEGGIRGDQQGDHNRQNGYHHSQAQQYGTAPFHSRTAAA